MFKKVVLFFVPDAVPGPADSVESRQTDVLCPWGANVCALAREG